VKELLISEMIHRQVKMLNKEEMGLKYPIPRTRIVPTN